MPDAPEPLVLDLIEWIAAEPRAYREVIDTWRTSCPRLTVWEDSIDRGFVTRRPLPGRGTFVFPTDSGLKYLQAHGRRPPAKHPG